MADSPEQPRFTIGLPPGSVEFAGATIRPGPIARFLRRWLLRRTDVEATYTFIYRPAGPAILERLAEALGTFDVAIGPLTPEDYPMMGDPDWTKRRACLAIARARAILAEAGIRAQAAGSGGD